VRVGGPGAVETRTVHREGGTRDAGAAARAVVDLLEGALVHAVAVRSRRVDVGELTDAVERLLR
jgi:hypothetical protein